MASIDETRSGPQLSRTLTGLVRSARPRQSAKNGLVLVPLFFTVNIWWDIDDVSGMALLIGRAVATLLIFSALSGAVYLFNDLKDVEQDRIHPVKRNRPIAAGIVPVNVAWVTAIILAVAGLGAAFALGLALGAVTAGYVALNIAYTLALKHLVVLDVMAVAGGFVLRAVAGTFAIDGTELTRDGVTAPIELNISPWLYVVTALGALFIALVKRRSELIAAGDGAGDQRAILKEYTRGLLDQLIVIVASATLMAYTLYTFSSGITESSNVPENNSMMLTIPFVAYGLFRYLYLMHVKGQGEAPEEALLTDRPLRINILLWLGTAAIVLLINAEQL
jgi:4-hydroxybenzoate polyprenyltransferase